MNMDPVEPDLVNTSVGNKQKTDVLPLVMVLSF